MTLPTANKRSRAAGAPAADFAVQHLATIFLGAFLLFQLEPMLAKAILPWFGGSPAVWTTCMLFFQVLLLAGYIYSHLISTRLAPRAQASVHIALLLASLCFLKILPSDAWRPSGVETPVWSILLLLSVNIGVPYLVLSATSPLVQAWARDSDPLRSPYRLYALSNIGSLLALLSYPFLFEPLLAIRDQAALWGALYVLFVLLCCWCAVSFLRSSHSLAEQPPVKNGPGGASAPPGPGSRSLWFILSACGSGLLLATTNQLTLNVSVVPFLWILPLGLYLVSFILCFDGDKNYSRPVWAVLLAFAGAGVCYLLYADTGVPTLLQVLICSLSLFVACMVCHGELAAGKPRPEHLTGFYILVSAGGAFGGALVAVAAPLWFSGPWEYHLFWLLVLSIMLAVLLRRTELSSTLTYRAARIFAVCLYIVFAGLLYGQYRLENRLLLTMERNFYGTLQVFESDFGASKIITLRHGQIDHGFQFLPGDPRRQRPVSYYGPQGGAGVTVRTMHKLAAAERRQLRMGVVGLGAGVMAAWCLPGDQMTFYELNPLSDSLSSEYFSYRRDSAGLVEVVMGDARLSLEREAGLAAKPLDILVLDAFSSDAVPLHLLTREAFAVYFGRLRPDGVLAVHVSNLFMDLKPLVYGLALDHGKKAVIVENPRDEAGGSEASTWVLVTANDKFLGEPLVKRSAAAWPAGRKPLVFTDRYSNLFSLIKFRK